MKAYEHTERGLSLWDVCVCLHVFLHHDCSQCVCIFDEVRMMNQSFSNNNNNNNNTNNNNDKLLYSLLQQHTTTTPP